MKENNGTTILAMSNEESANRNSIENMVQDATTNKGDKVRKVENANDKEPEVVSTKRISLSQSEKAVVSLIEKLIGENTAKIARLIFSTEIEAEFQKQISELENDNQKKNANILRVMQEKFLCVESGSTFVEFKSNVSELRQKAIAEYKERFEAEKLINEKRKAIESQISALLPILESPSTIEAAKDAIQMQIDILRKQLASI